MNVPLAIWGITNVGRDVERHRQPEYIRFHDSRLQDPSGSSENIPSCQRDSRFKILCVVQYSETFQIGLNEPQGPDVYLVEGGRLYITEIRYRKYQNLDPEG
jgi:hypothetical protein